MTQVNLTRRAAMFALAGAIAAPVAAGAQAPSARFRGFRVDVTPLRQRGYGPIADWVAQTLPPALEQAFAGHRAGANDRSAPSLVVRIDSVVLGRADHMSRRGRSGFGGLDLEAAARDSMEGVATVLSSGGAIISQTPLLNTDQTDPGIPADDPYQLHRRVAAMAHNFAYWLPRQMGL